MHQRYPILEFDPTRRAIIEPSRVLKSMDVPENCVICFFNDVINTIVNEKNARLIKNLRSEIGLHPLYEIEWQSQRIAFYHPGIGGAMAAASLEELIALGCRKFIACGGAGVLDREIAVGHVVVPTAAIRDEGASYHYLPPSRAVSTSRRALTAIKQTLRARNVEFVTGKTWTTDAIYRETAMKVKQRRAEGCLTVEMEAAAFFAVAKFRRVAFGQMLYGGDDVSSAEWDSRGWTKRTSVREKLFWLSAEACLAIQ